MQSYMFRGDICPEVYTELVFHGITLIRNILRLEKGHIILIIQTYTLK